MQLEKKIIVITKEKNPRLYKVLRRKGGTKFNSVVMTIKKQPKNLLQKNLPSENTNTKIYE